VLGWADDLTRRLERAVAAYREEESAERRALLAELWVQGRAEDRRDRTEREERAERDRQMIYRTLGLPYGSTE
jgi:hypothetical protein